MPIMKQITKIVFLYISDQFSFQAHAGEFMKKNEIPEAAYDISINPPHKQTYTNRSWHIVKVS